jgi:hypothetical protein
LDRQIELEPDQTLNSVYKAELVFSEKADVKGVRAAYEALPSSAKDDPAVTWERAVFAVCARDFAAAEEIVSKSPNEEIFFWWSLSSTPNRCTLDRVPTREASHYGAVRRCT